MRSASFGDRGDQPGVLDVHHRVTHLGANIDGLQWWAGGYDDLGGVAWSPNNSAGTLAHVDLRVLNSQSLRLDGFRLGSWAGAEGRLETVSVTRIGDSDPALVGPWTMGRDKRNPKPLDAGAFATLVKTASEVLRRHEQAARERLHRTLSFTGDDGQRLRADLDVVPDDDDPHAILAIVDEASDERLREGRVRPNVKLTAATAQRFLRTGEA